MQLMITNGGTHPADKWADIVADQIVGLIEVADDSVSDEAKTARAVKRSMRPALFDVLEPYFERVQSTERAECKKDGKRVRANLDPTGHLPGIRGKVQKILEATPFAAHFARPEVWAIVETYIAQASANNMHIERRWHAQRAGKGD